jgi:cytochrome P450
MSERLEGGGLSLGPEFVANPYAMYDALRAAGPIVGIPSLFGLPARLVTSHALGQTILRGRQFLSDAAEVLPPDVLSKIPVEAADTRRKRRHTLLFRDPPDHTRLRKLVNQAFTPRNIERLRGRIAEITGSLLDAAAGEEVFDLIAGLAFPLPIIVIAEMLGVPAEDRDMLRAWSNDLSQGLNPAADAAMLERVERSVDRFDEYMSAILEERRRAPRNDLVTDLVRAREEGDRLSEEELLATCRLVLSAGHETTVNLIGNGVLALLRHPAERAALAADPELSANAVEEMLRYDSPVQLTIRFAAERTALADHTVERGDLVVALIGAMNRDPAVFADPGRFDVRRPNAREHLSFGAGIHYCLGAALARMEGQIAIGMLLQRFPDLALAGEELKYRSHPTLRGVESLPLRLRP